MKKFLLSVLLCAGVAFTLSPMKRQRSGQEAQEQEQVVKLQRVQDFSILNELLRFPDLVFCLVCQLDGESISALTSVSETFHKYCDTVLTSCLPYITCADAALHGNANLTKRFLAEYKEDGTLFQPTKCSEFEAKIADLGSLKMIKFNLGSLVIFKDFFEIDYFNDACTYKFFIDFGKQQMVGFGIDSRQYLDAVKYVVKRELNAFGPASQSMGSWLLKQEVLPKQIDFFNQVHRAHRGSFHSYRENPLRKEDVIYLSSTFVEDEEVKNQCPCDFVNIKASAHARLEYFCLNVIFIVAAQRNYTGVLQALFKNPMARNCLSIAVLEVASDKVADPEMVQMLDKEIERRKLLQQAEQNN